MPENSAPRAAASPVGALRSGWVSSASVSLLAFLTVVDLFATQAILPSLATAYGVSAAVIGPVVNASTLGMAVGGAATAFLGQGIDRRRAVVLALALLSLPTAFLATMPNLWVFSALRVVQGVLMASAFTLTLSHMSEVSRRMSMVAGAAAYITGNVASNLFGRFMSAAIADMYGLSTNFIVFSALNLIGSAFAYVLLADPASGSPLAGSTAPTMGSALERLRKPDLVAAFGIAFCILFAFIGTFTYVNFVLVRPPLSISMMSVGFSYLVFLPSIVVTPMAGSISAKHGTRTTLWASLGVAGAGLPLLLSSTYAIVLAGMTLVGVGTFLAQATATGYVGRAASEAATAANGTYLASYFAGGLVGSIVLGQIFVRGGWGPCVAIIALSLILAAVLTRYLLEPGQEGSKRQ